MDRSYGQLTVYFEDPFWVGVFERITGGKLSVCKVTFGAEPKEYEVLDFVLKHYYDLHFSPAVEAGEKQTADNPKRRQRNARKQQLSTGIGTKSQQARFAGNNGKHRNSLDLSSAGRNEKRNTKGTEQEA